MVQPLSEKILDPGIINLNDYQVALELHKKSNAFPIRKNIETAEIANYAARQQIVWKIRNLKNSQNESVKELAETCEFILDGRWQTIKCSDPDVDLAFKTQIQSLVLLGTISQIQANDIIAMADDTISWAQANNRPNLTHIDVAIERRGGV